MKTRRFLAAVLAMVMLLALMPVTVEAADGTVYDAGKLYLDKTAELMDDGTYTIRLEAFATGTPVTTSVITGKPLDVVLVIDQSGSIYNDGYSKEIQKAVEAFIDQLVENGKTIGKTHRVAVVGFACSEWEVTVTQSIGVNTTPYEGNLPLADGSYAQLWTNTGIFLNDGTFKNYQTFEFEEVPPAEETLERTNMTVGSYQGNYTSNNWFDIEGFFTADGEQIQAKVTRGGYMFNRTYSWQFQTKSGKALSFNVTNKDETNASVNNQETYTKTVVGGLPAYSSSNDPYYVTYGTYTHPVNGGDAENRKFPLYFVDDTESWPGQTVRRAIYRHSDGKFYYDFRGYDRLDNTVNPIEVDLTDKTVYKIKYDYNTATGEFNGGYLTEADYQNTFMNVTDGAAGGGNITAALNKISSGLGASGATRTGTGMEMARKILESNPLTEEDKAEGRERVVIVFTDGVPGQSLFEIDEANAAIAEAAKIKAMTGTDDHVDVYALGLFKENVATELDTEVFMNGLSSNYPTAEKYEDVYATSYTYSASNNFSLRNYRNTNWTTVSGYYAKDINGNYGELQARRTGSSNSTWEFRTVAGVAVQLTVSGTTNSPTVSSGIYTRRAGTSDYTDAGTPREDGGKYYTVTTNVEDLAQMFPYIVTESTSTSLDSVYLTEGSILRDIMGAGFLLTGETTISAFTEEGTWTPIGDDDSKQGTIEWTGNEVQFCEPKHIEDPKTLTKPNVNDPIQVYNTNPDPENGNFYETASGEPNLSAPPTIDITGFDYEEEYLAVNKTGRKLIVTITGVEAQALDVLYNQQNQTNHYQSGLWSPMKEDRTRELVGSFPVPTTTFTEAMYVLDYAKPMDIPVSDLKMFRADSLDEDGMNYFNPAVSGITEGNGSVTLENGQLVYRPATTSWDGYDTFYVFGESDDAGIKGFTANANGNLWSQVHVIPANNVYYEDTFIESQNGVTVGIEYGGDWSYAQEGDNREHPESGETNDGGEQPFGGVHGWEDYLADDTRYSDGGAAISSAAGATATFTFTGTGVDVYSYTDMEQGAVMASIYAGEEATGKPLYSLIMDNFSLSGDYYQIPTLSLHEKYLRDDAGKNVKDDDGNNVLVPLGFGTYTVKLTVMPKTDDADGDGVKTTRYTYTLDGIRIYNPIQNKENDEVVQKAYGEEELNASFVEVRDILLDAGSFDADGECYGVVFLDQVPNGDGNLDNEEEGTVGQPSDQYENAIGVYEDYGPKNEVYLDSFQSIAFIPNAGYRCYVGLKSPTGEPAVAAIYKDGFAQELTITHTTDLYYEVTPEEGVVLIENFGDNLLSVTKIKVTGPDGSEVEPAEFFEPVDQPTVLRMVRTLREEAAAEPEVPEEMEPSAPDVEIDNPAEPGEPEEDGSNDGYLWQVIGGIFDWIRYIIFG